MDNLVRLGVITRIFGLKGDVICSLDFKVIPEIVIPCKVNLGFTEGYSKEIFVVEFKTSFSLFGNEVQKYQYSSSCNRIN